MGISSIRKRTKRILALLLAFAMLMSNFSDFRLVVKADATVTQDSDGGEEPDGGNGNGGQTQTTLTVKFGGEVAGTEEYTGETINLPELVVTDGTEQLESTAYTVKWTNEKGESVYNTVTNAGIYTCTVTVNEDPSKVGTITFEVTKKSIQGAIVSGIGNVSFDGNNVSGLDGLTVELDGAPLLKNSDYTVRYVNSTGEETNSISKEGIYTLQIIGMGNYTDTSERELKVTRTINTMDLSIEPVTYNGQAVAISNLTVNGLDCAYSVSSSGEVKKAGDYSLIVTADDNKRIYTGSTTVDFTVERLDLENCTVSIEPSAIPYTGNEVNKPSVEVRYNGNVISNEDYDVAYSTDILKEKGEYSVTVTAKDNGNLTGRKTADFSIVYSGSFSAEDAVSGTIEQRNMSGLNMVYNSTENKYFYKLDDNAEEKKVTIKPQENYEFVKILSPTSDKIVTEIEDENLVITFSSQDTAVVAEQDIAITLLVKSVDDESYNEISIILAEASFIAFETNSEVSISYETQYTITENESTINWANKITNIDFPKVSESGAGNITYYYSTDANREDKTNSIPASASLDYSIFNSETTYYYWAEDALGNQTGVIEFTICKLDANAPTITVKKNEGDTEAIANGRTVFWNADEAVDDGNDGKKIDIFVEASDSESGLTEDYSSGIQSSFRVIEGIVSSIEIFQSISDKVGNLAEHTFTAVYDPIAPTVEVELSTNGRKTEDSTDTNMLSSDDVIITFKITGKAKYNDIVLLDRVDITDDKDKIIKSFDVEELTYNEDDTEPYYEGTYTVTTEEWLKNTYTITAFDNACNVGENSSVTITIEIDKIAPKIAKDSISIAPEVTGEDNWTKENTAFVVTVPNNAPDKDSSAKVYLEYKKAEESIWVEVSDYKTDENGNLIFGTPVETDDFYNGKYQFRVKDELENIVDNDNDGEADVFEYTLKKDSIEPESTAYIQFISDIEGANENEWRLTNDSWYSQISKMASSLWNKIWSRTTLSFEVYVRDEHSGVDSVTVSYGDTNTILEKPVDGIEVVALEGNTDGGYQKRPPVEDGDKLYTVFTGSITIANSEIKDISYNDFAISEIKDNAGNTTTDISLKNADDNTVIYLDSVKPKLTGVEIASDKLVRETYYYNHEVSVALTIEERFLEDAEAPKVEIYKKTSKDTQFTTSSIVENLEWNLVEGTTQYTTNIPLECVSEEEIEYQIRVTYKDGSDNELVSEDYSVTDGVYTSPTIVLDGKAPKLNNYTITEEPSGEVNGISVYKNNVESDDVTVTFILDDNAEYWDGNQNRLLITVKDSISGDELVKMDGTDSYITWSDNDRAHTGTFKFDGESTAASNYLVTISYTDRAGNAMTTVLTTGAVDNKGVYTSEEFILDHVAPVFNVSYNAPYLFRTAGDTALSSDDKSGTEIDMKNVSGYTAHYKEDIEVSFTIDEQYAVPMTENTVMTGLNDCIVTVIKDGEAMETLPEIAWTKANTESDYEGKFTLTEDGTYEIIVKYQDTAANAMVAGDEVNGAASMDDGTYRSIKLVLDKTVPVVSVAYVDQTTQTEAVPTEADGRIYFTNPVNMRITVTDSYIRTEELRKVILDALVVKDADGKDITENTVNIWLNELVSNDAEVKANEVVWDIPLTTEANYTFDFVYTDLVGLSGNKVLEKVTVDKTTPEADDAWIAFSSDVEGANEQSILDKLHQFWNKIWGRTEIGFTVYVRDEIADIASMEVSYVVDDTEDNVIEYSTIDANKKPLTIQNDKYQVKNEAENVTVEYVMITGTLTLSDITDASDLLLNQFTITSLKDKAGNDACEENVITFSKDGYSGNIYLDNQNPKLVNVYVDETFIKEAELPYHYNKEVEVVLEVDERFLHDAANFPKVTLRCEKTSALAAGEVKTWEEVVENLNWDNKVSNTVSTYYTTVTLPVVENSEIEYQIKMTYQDGAKNLLISNDSSAYSVENGIYTSEIIVVDDVAPELTAYEISGNSDREVNGISVYKNVEDDDVTVTVTLDDNAEYWNGYQNQLLIKVKDSISGVELVRMDGTDSDITWSDNDRAHTGTFTFDGESTEASNYLVTISYTDRAGNAMVIDNAAITEGSYAGNTYTSKEFILDHVAPVFNISYNTPYRNVKEGNAAANDVLGAEDVNLQPQTGYTSYYQDEIVATFTIDEQYANFENGLADSTITVYKDGEEISLENNPTVKLTWEAQETTYTGTLTIKADEANNVSADGNYQIEISYFDTAKNDMTAGEKVHGSEAATRVTSGTYKSTTLVLDTTKPVISFKYVDANGTLDPSNTVGTRNYFMPDVTMQVIVEDVNLRNNELKHALLDKMTAVDSDGTSMKETTTPYLDIEALKDTDIISEEVVIELALTSEANYTFTCPSAENIENYESLFIYEDLAGNKIEFETQEVTADHTIPDKVNVWIQFTSDVEGLNDENIIQKVIRKITEIWNKIWGRNTIGFTVYVRDEIAGIAFMEMSYNSDTEDGTEVYYAASDTAENKLTIAEEKVAIDGINYVAITGSIAVADDTDLLVNNFRITSLVDNAGNDACEEGEITFSTGGASIYLDDVTPKVTGSVVIDAEKLDGTKTYYYNDTVEVALTLEERFFEEARELERAPIITVYVKESTEAEYTEEHLERTIAEDFEADEKVWKKDADGKYTAIVELPLVEDSEKEYLIQVTYTDGSDNLLETEDTRFAINEGIYTSPVIVIDDINPVLTSFAFAGSTYEIKENANPFEADVYNNNVEAVDITVNFSIDDNATYWTKENLTITVRDIINKKDIVVMQGNNTNVSWTDAERIHAGSFVFDGEADEASNYEVILSYKDLAVKDMQQGAMVTEGTTVDGVYISKDFILDHVVPVFNISYLNNAYRLVSNADNNATADKKSVQPETGYTAYYKEDIRVEFTIDEQYAIPVYEETVGNTAVMVDLKDYKLTITNMLTGQELKEEELPKITWSVVDNGIGEPKQYQGIFVIEKEGTYQISMSYKDTALNVMTEGSTVNGELTDGMVKADGTYQSVKLVLDKKAPKIAVAYVDQTTGEEVTQINSYGERKYFSKPVVMRITVEDANLRYHELKEYLLANLKVTDVKGINISGSEAVKNINALEDSYISTNGITCDIRLDTEANYEFPISYEDLAGNVATDETQRATMDQTKPTLKLEYSVTNAAFKDAVNYKDLGFVFADHKLTIQATASDEIAGVHIIRYTIINENGEKTIKESEIEPSANFSCEVAIPLETNDFNDTIKVEVLDWSANDNEESHGYIVESTEKHSTTGSAKITTKTAPSRIVEGVKYYNTSVDLNITLEDNYSGLRSYEYKAGVKDKELKGEHNYADEAGKDLSEGKEHSITKLYSKDLTLDGKVNNENDVLVTAKFVDNAGHVTSVEQKYNIDTTVPEITVEYDLNEPSYEKFYHQTRTATVKIKERNFSEKDVDFTITNTDGELPSIGNWSKSGSGDDTVHTCQIVFSADGDYTFTLAFQDLAGNKAKYDRTDEFTIDQTKPVYTVSYDNNNSLNDYYYAQTRTATIDILEHNFDASLINVVMTANAGGVVPSVSSWSRDGDHNIATVTFSTDGDYTFAISGKDQAENEMDAYAQERFIIDLTAPEIEIFDIEPNSANNGIVMPGIRYSDTNYDINGSSVHMVGYHNGEVEMKGTTSRTDIGVEVKLNDFEHVQAMDDLYTMNAVVSDLAGNITEASVTFSVNRYGSVYTFDEITDKLVGDEGNFYTNEEQDIVVIETNVDTLEFKEITCNLNGTLTTLVEGEDYTVSESGTDASWKQYTYTIAKENFVEEGNYLLTIYSEDRALNTSDSNTKNKRIEFVVDKTMPSVLISGVENNGQYRENSRPVTLDIEDNVMLSEVKVILNGEEIIYPASEISATDGRLEFVIDSYNDWQTLQVIAIDKAGNENALEEIRFLVTANVFVQFFRNETLVWGTAGGMTVAAGGIYWLLLARRKRKVTFKK